MNEVTRPASGNRTTQAAEGLPRWRWTTAELVRLADMGAFRPEDRFELIGGEIVPMSPVGRGHEVVAERIELLLRGRQTEATHVVTERQLNLNEDTYTKPDLWVRPAPVLAADIRGNTVLLVVEIAASSLAFDLGTKAATYARHGVREYWVVDAATLVTTVHRTPRADGYGDTRTVPASEMLVALLVPELAIRLADLRVD